MSKYTQTAVHVPDYYACWLSLMCWFIYISERDNSYRSDWSMYLNGCQAIWTFQSNCTAYIFKNVYESLFIYRKKKDPSFSVSFFPFFSFLCPCFLLAFLVGESPDQVAGLFAPLLSSLATATTVRELDHVNTRLYCKEHLPGLLADDSL